jgi:hypothetical protein
MGNPNNLATPAGDGVPVTVQQHGISHAVAPLTCETHHIAAAPEYLKVLS